MNFVYGFAASGFMTVQRDRLDGVIPNSPNAGGRSGDGAELRYITVGKLDGRMVVMVWTPRGEARRIVSMRKANDREQARYAYRVVDPDDAPELTDDFFNKRTSTSGTSSYAAAAAGR